MRQRQASIDETRARIVDAAVDLYESAGPAATTMSAVAVRAGITRATLYRHFPGDADLANAVMDEWLTGAVPATDDASLVAIPDFSARLRTALVGLYAGYRTTAAMTANLLRDAHAVPAARQADLRAAARLVRGAIVRTGFPGVGAAPAEAALGHATAFETWRSLSSEGLDDATITDLMVGFVTKAAARTPKAGARTPRAASQPDSPAAGEAPGSAASAAEPLPADEPRRKSKGGGKGKAKGGKKGKGERKRKGRESERG